MCFDDLSLDVIFSEMNCMVEWVCYEGESWFYVVVLDCGDEFKVWVSYENVIKFGICVFV